MEQIANLAITFLSVLIGATIFALVSVLCGYSPFYDLDYTKALALCGTIGAFAFLFSDMPQAMISIAKLHPNGDWPLLEQALTHVTTVSSYKGLAVNGFALAFVISGFIGSDFLLDLRKFFSRKTAVRIPVSEWDALLWLYGKTGDEVTVHLKESSRAITGALDFRSIGAEEQAIVLKNPRSNTCTLGDYLYIKGSEISTISLKSSEQFGFKSFVWRNLISKNWHYALLFLLGLIALFIQHGWWNDVDPSMTLTFEFVVLGLFFLYSFLKPT